jgi:hypothetical protein
MSPVGLGIKNDCADEDSSNFPDCAVDIATGYELDGQRVRVRVPVETGISLVHFIQTGSETHTASYTMGTGGPFQG